MEGEVMAVFYQNILTEIAPYCVKLMHPNVFGEHRHADIELHYCIKGSFEVIIDKRSPTSWFISVDLPTLGLPMIFTKPALIICPSVCSIKSQLLDCSTHMNPSEAWQLPAL